MKSNTLSVESFMNSVFAGPNPEHSEEVYFGVKNPLSVEMVENVTALRDALKTAIGAEWTDIDKALAVIKNETSVSKASTSDIVKILDKIGNSIERNCNVEKCYVSLINGVDAYTYPMSMDSSLIIDNSKSDAVITLKNGYEIDPNKIRSYSDINDKLMTLEDIAIVKDGYKFKVAKGKVMILTIGVPLLLHPTISTSVESICAVIFHEIGHNFQNFIHGANQTIINKVTQGYLKIIEKSKWYSVFDFIAASLISDELKAVLKAVDGSPEFRKRLITMVLSRSVWIDREGNLITRHDIGKEERSTLLEVVAKAKEQGIIVEVSNFTKFIITTGESISRLFKLALSPFRYMSDSIRYKNLDKNYGDLIKENKTYEQFADSFAVAYGFGKASATMHLEIQKLIERYNKRVPTHADFLNYIPVLSAIQAMNEVRSEILSSNINGYDIGSVRASQAYQLLDYEINNNKDLTKDQRLAIMQDMEGIKDLIDSFKAIEMSNMSSAGSNKGLIMKLLGKFNGKDIYDTSSDSGIVENVIEVVEEMASTGKVNRNTQTNKDIIDVAKNSGKFEKFLSNVKETMDRFTSGH